MFKSKFGAVGSAAAVVASSLVFVGANAGAALASCPPDDYYSTWGASQNNIDMVHSAWGGPGITLSIALTRSSSTTSSYTATASFSVSDVISTAQAEISHSIEYSMTAEITYTGSGTIPSSWSRGGYLHAGAHRYHYSWAHYETTPQCSMRTLASGTMNSPYAIPAFWLSQA